jgi:preprotein translocase subunit SecG
MMNLMFGINFWIGLLLTCYIPLCLLLLLVVLMQRSKQEGLGASFGGGLTESVFGAQTSQVLVKLTIWMAGIFFVLTIALAHLYAHRAGGSEIQRRLSAPLPAASAPASPASNPVVPELPAK